MVATALNFGVIMNDAIVEAMIATDPMINKSFRLLHTKSIRLVELRLKSGFGDSMKQMG